MFKPSTWVPLVTGRGLRPWMRVRNIAEIPIDLLREAGIKGLVFDVDNTLTDHHSGEIHELVQEAFAQLCHVFSCAIYSNCDAHRWSQLQTIFGDVIPIVPHGIKKPAPAGFARAARLLDLPHHQVAIAGDRLLTDVLGGNRSGFKTILVEAFGNPEPRLIRLMRRIEHQRLKWGVR